MLLAMFCCVVWTAVMYWYDGQTDKDIFGAFVLGLFVIVGFYVLSVYGV